MLLSLKAEETRLCPIDGHELMKTVVQNLVIDKCPKCHGVWLDGGELELIKQAMPSGAGGGQFAMGFVMGVLLG